jgi:hypothetical protein
MKGDYRSQLYEKSMKKACTLGFPTELLNLLSTWHELGVDIELSTPPSDKMAVLNAQILSL